MGQQSISMNEKCIRIRTCKKNWKHVPKAWPFLPRFTVIKWEIIVRGISILMRKYPSTEAIGKCYPKSWNHIKNHEWVTSGRSGYVGDWNEGVIFWCGISTMHGVLEWHPWMRGGASDGRRSASDFCKNPNYFLFKKREKFTSYPFSFLRWRWWQSLQITHTRTTTLVVHYSWI